MTRILTALMCICACCAASAATREWRNGSGSVDDSSHWGGTAPVAGVTKVDFGVAPGASAPKPLPRGLEVANFTGASIGAWKGVNLGDPTLTAAFRLEGGKVLCDFRRSGMVIVVK